MSSVECSEWGWAGPSAGRRDGACARADWQGVREVSRCIMYAVHRGGVEWCITELQENILSDLLFIWLSHQALFCFVFCKWFFNDLLSLLASFLKRSRKDKYINQMRGCWSDGIFPQNFRSGAPLKFVKLHIIFLLIHNIWIWIYFFIFLSLTTRHQISQVVETHCICIKPIRL